jgi:hypothetical protein
MLCLEVSRQADGSVVLVLSIPGHEGATERVWRPPVAWEDLQASALKALSDFLWVSGGIAMELPWTEGSDALPVEDPGR